MRTFLGIVFIWTQAYRDNSKSALVYLYLCKHMTKGQKKPSSHSCTDLSEAQFFPVSIAKINFSIDGRNFWPNEMLQGVKKWHCLKRGRVRSFSGLHFHAFELNTEIYSVNLRIQSKFGKMQTKKNSKYGHFSRCVKSLSTNLYTEIIDSYMCIYTYMAYW